MDNGLPSPDGSGILLCLVFLTRGKRYNGRQEKAPNNYQLSIVNCQLQIHFHQTFWQIHNDFFVFSVYFD